MMMWGRVGMYTGYGTGLKRTLSQQWRIEASSRGLSSEAHMQIPKIMGTFLGIPIIGIIVFGGLYWGPPI